MRISASQPRDLRLLYVVGFSLSEPAGRTIGTLNKYRELNATLPDSRLLSLTDALTYRMATRLGAPRLLRKGLAFFELNARVLVECIVVRRWNTVIVRDFLLFSPLLLKLFGVKLIAEVHADTAEEAKLTKPWFWAPIVPLYSWLTNRQIKKAKGVIFNHPSLQQYFVGRLRLTSPTLAAYNGADIQQFHPLDKQECRRKLGVPAESPALMYVGRVNIWHGVEFLLSTFAELSKLNPDVLMYVVGGEEDGYLGSVHKKLGHLDRVFYTGPVSREGSMVYMNAADICMLPVNNNVRASPGSPIKLYDYIACGKPIITQENTLGYSDVVCGENLGIAVDFHAPGAAAAAIQHYLAGFGQVEKDVNAHIRRVAETKLSWHCVIAQWLNFIDSVPCRDTQ